MMAYLTFHGSACVLLRVIGLESVSTLRIRVFYI